MTAIWLFLKAVPLRAWLVTAGVFLAFLLVLQYNAHEREIGRQQSAATIATLQAQLAAAQQANAGNDAAVQTLQSKLRECEAGRVADSDLAAKAKAAYAEAIATFKADDATQHAKTAKLLATTCAAIANQPSCVVADRQPMGGTP